MNREELVRALAAARPEPGEMVYIERRGDDYRWRRAGPEAGRAGPRAARPGEAPGDSARPAPEAWIYYSGPWPVDDPDRFAAFVADLLAEMDAMAVPGDRCRWPLDQPYPLPH